MISNFSGAVRSNFQPAEARGELHKAADEPARRPDGRGESELGVTVEHTNGDPKTTDLARVIAEISREQVAKNPNLDKVELGKRIIAQLAAKGYSVAQSRRRTGRQGCRRRSQQGRG